MTRGGTGCVAKPKSCNEFGYMKLLSEIKVERDSSSSSSMCQSEIVDSPGGADGQATEQQRENQAKRKLQGVGASVGINATACVRVKDICMATNSSALFAKN